MTSFNSHPRSSPRPVGCLLMVLAALLCTRGALLNRPEPPAEEWEHQGGQQFLVFDPAGALIVGTGATLTWYDPLTGRAGSSIRADGTLTSIAISPDGQWLATGTENGTLTLWTGAPNWRSVESIQSTSTEAENKGIFSLAFSQNSQALIWIAYSRTATWMRTATAHVWDRSSRQDYWSLTRTAQGAAATAGLDQIRLSADNQRVVLIGQNLDVYNRETNKLLYRIEGNLSRGDIFVSVAVSPDQEWLAIGGRGKVTIRRFSDGTEVHVIEGREGYDHSIAFSPDSHYLAMESHNIQTGGFFIGMPFSTPAREPVTLWRVEDWREVQRFEGHRNGGGYALVYSPDGHYIATYGIGDDRTIRVWRIEPRNPFEPLAWFGSGLALLFGAVARWIWRRRGP